MGHGQIERMQAQEDLDRARVELLRAPRDPLGYQRLGDVYAALGLPDAAEPHYRTAVSLDAAGSSPRLALAAVLESQGRHGDALGALVDAATANPGDRRARERLAGALRREPSRLSRSWHEERLSRLSPALAGFYLESLGRGMWLPSQRHWVALLTLGLLLVAALAVASLEPPLSGLGVGLGACASLGLLMTGGRWLHAWHSRSRWLAGLRERPVP